MYGELETNAILDFRSRCTGFDSLSDFDITWIRVFVVFLGSVLLLEQNLEWGHDRLLPSPYLLAVYGHSILHELLRAIETSSLNKVRISQVSLAVYKCGPSADCHFLRTYARSVLWDSIMPEPFILHLHVAPPGPCDVFWPHLLWLGVLIAEAVDFVFMFVFWTMSSYKAVYIHT